MLRVLILMCCLVSLGAATKEEAATLMDDAVALMEASNDDSSKSVDAAVLLVQARDIYKSLGDWDNVREANAYIFYCKKKMNVDDLDKYVARTSGDKATAEKAIAVADSVANEKVTADQAGAYFKQAKAFADANSNAHFKIHIRYLEVAERFADSNTQVASQAMRLSSEALQAWSKTLGKDEVLPESVFLRSYKSKVDLFGQSKKPNGPDEKNAKSILKNLKKEHKEKFKSKKVNQFANWLYDTALASKQDLDLAYVLADEAAQNACDRKVLNISLMMHAAEFLSKHYNGLDVKRRQLAYLDSISSSPLGKAALLLLEQPGDKEANSLLGKSFCFVGDNWKEGLTLLEAGEDGEWKRAAQMERLNPSEATQILELADLWFELADERDAKDYKIAIYQRALSWYQKAMPKLDGLVKTRTEKRIKQLLALVPFDPDSVDFDQLTEEQWELIPGKSIKCSLADPKNKTGLKLKEGEQVRVVPHPTEEWGITAAGGINRTATYKGIDLMGGMGDGGRGGRGGRGPGGRGPGGPGGFAVGNMQVFLSKEPEAAPLGIGVIDGPGEVFIGGSVPRRPGIRAVGSIRVKIIPVGVVW